jgi:alanine-glyoxylate transaminase/serine-glyoxylate transaminase/serine-pyruvate transaminase
MSKPRPLAPGTTAVHVVLQVTEALRMIHEEGLEHVCRRHAQMSNRLRQGLSDLGLALQCPKLQRESTTLTAVLAPAGLAPKAIRDGLEARGILVAEGLGPYDATAFRIGHMGDIRMADIERTLTALGDLLPHVQA